MALIAPHPLYRLPSFKNQRAGRSLSREVVDCRPPPVMLERPTVGFCVSARKVKLNCTAVPRSLSAGARSSFAGSKNSEIIGVREARLGDIHPGAIDHRPPRKRLRLPTDTFCFQRRKVEPVVAAFPRVCGTFFACLLSRVLTPRMRRRLGTRIALKRRIKNERAASFSAIASPPAPSPRFCRLERSDHLRKRRGLS